MVQGNFTLPADCRDLTKPENNSAEWLQRVPAKAGYNSDAFSICRAVRLANPKSITIADLHSDSADGPREGDAGYISPGQ